jgi:hypothetical protein
VTERRKATVKRPCQRQGRQIRSSIVTAWKWAVKNRYAYRGSARDYSNTYDIAEQLPTRSKGKPDDEFLSNEELTTLWLTQPGDLRMSMTPISRVCLVQNVSV